MIGFVSLLVSPIPSVRTFGLFSALGAAVAFVLGAVAVPAALRVLEPAGRAAGRDRTRRAARRASRALLGAPRRARARRLTARSRWPASRSLPRLRVSTHDGEFFPPDHALNRAYDFIEARLGGITPLEIVFESERPAGLRDPAALAAIARVQDFLDAEPATLRGVSIADWVDQARDALEPAEARALAARRRGARARRPSCSRRWPADDLPYWVRDDWTPARLSTRSLGLDSEQNDALLLRVEAAAREALAGVPGRARHGDGPRAGVRAHGGVPAATARSSPSPPRCSRSSSVFALLLRSLGWALVAMVPNVVPVRADARVDGARAAIPLDVVTVMIASITLGVVVDDTIHLLHGFRARARAEGMAPGAAMGEALARAATRSCSRRSCSRSASRRSRSPSSAPPRASASSPR